MGIFQRRKIGVDQGIGVFVRGVERGDRIVHPVQSACNTCLQQFRCGIQIVLHFLHRALQRRIRLFIRAFQRGDCRGKLFVRCKRFVGGLHCTDRFFQCRLHSVNPLSERDVFGLQARNRGVQRVNGAFYPIDLRLQRFAGFPNCIQTHVFAGRKTIGCKRTVRIRKRDRLIVITPTFENISFLLRHIGT